jgi:hypothetical protein
MECQEFLARFSDLVDGKAGADASRMLREHQRVCERCRRYAHTFEAGRDLLASMPPLDVPPDFRRRLQHRILHLQDGPSLSRESLGSGASPAWLLSVALLIAAAAWAPTLGIGTETVELPKVVVTGPAPGSFSAPPVDPTFHRNLSFFSTTEFQEGIWGDSHVILREYSPIMDRRRELSAMRVGIE